MSRIYYCVCIQKAESQSKQTRQAMQTLPKSRFQNGAVFDRDQPREGRDTSEGVWNPVSTISQLD
jgi:hypothetical protein